MWLANFAWLACGAAIVTTLARFEITSLLGKKLESQAQASLWQNVEAAATCTKALGAHPDSIELLTERGHRRVALRQFAEAKADMTRAAQLGIAWVGPTAPAGHSEFYYNLVRRFQKAKTEAGIVPAPAGRGTESELRSWGYAGSEVELARMKGR